MPVETTVGAVEMAQGAKAPVSKPDEFSPWDPRGGKKEKTPTSCPLTLHVLCSKHTTNHTYTL